MQPLDFTPTENTIILTIPETMQDYIEVCGDPNLRLYTPSTSVEDHCTTRAIVRAVPPNCPLPIKVGHQVAISYMVVASGNGLGAGRRTHSRRFMHRGEKLWRANLNDIIAIIREDHYEAVGEYVTLLPLVERSEAANEILSEIANNPEAARIRDKGNYHVGVGLDMLKGHVAQNKAILCSGTFPGAKKGDVLCFADIYCSKYDMPDRRKKHLWFINKTYIRAVIPQ